MEKTILSTKMLSKTFSQGAEQQHVLKNLTIDIYEGDFTVIMGVSGSGKSTLLYAISGMDSPSLGEVFFKEELISNRTADELAVFRRENVGFIFQQIYLIDSMSVLDNVLASAYLTKKDRKQLVENAKQILLAMGISENTLHKLPSQLSGGEAQRVGIARAVINNPLIVFADEPTGALNSKSSADVLDVLTKMNNNGQSIVMVTHDIKSACRASRVLYLKDGNIIGDLKMDKYASDSKANLEKLKAFLGEMGW